MTTRPPVTTAPLRVALVNDYELVLRGLAQMFSPYRDRITVVELNARMPVSRPVDIALYDPHGRAQSEQHAVDELMSQRTVGKVVVYGWGSGSELDHGGRHRAAGVLSKGLGAQQLVDGLERIHRGTPLELTPTQREHRGSSEWPGRREGLTPRESEIIALITQGLSNQAIADLTYLSINSVKSYIRTAYRRMNVTSRSQAVLWGVQHGLEPDRARIAS
ncbi:MAG: response regulator transcription factor [Humibacillus sp.]|nr:response regulator transcription factor [Humibacillus sp.]MDN5775720.1 response regulator transcription factor [Humibacillus sp.]